MTSELGQPPFADKIKSGIGRCSDITCAISPPIHPIWLRRSSVTYRRVRALLAPCQMGASAAIFAQVISAQLLSATVAQFDFDGYPAVLIAMLDRAARKC